MNRPERGDITHRAFQFPHLPRDWKSHVTHPQQVWESAECVSTHAIYAYAFQQIILSITVKLNALYTLLQNKKNAKNQKYLKIVIFRRLSVVEVY